MFELFTDKINITKSKQKEKLVYIKHYWSDEINIPFLTLLLPFIWFFCNINISKGINNEHFYIHIIALIFLIFGIFSFYINFSKIQKFQIIETGLSEIINREIVLHTSKKLEIVIYNDNMKLFRGTYDKSFPFKQIVSIIYYKDKILFNSRNICIGSNGKLGRPPWGLKSSEKLYQLYKKNIEEQVNIYKETNI